MVAFGLFATFWSMLVQPLASKERETLAMENIVSKRGLELVSLKDCMKILVFYNLGDKGPFLLEKGVFFGLAAKNFIV